MKKALVLALLTSWVALLAQSCSGTDTEGEPPFEQQKSACERAYEELCKQACGCAGGVGCSFNDPPPGATTTVGSLADCESLLIQAECKGGSNPNVDYEACEADVKSAKCITDKNGKLAVARPHSCTVPVDKPDGGKDASKG